MTLRVALAPAVLAALTGCSGDPPRGAAASAANPCDGKLLTAADLAGVVSDPVTVAVRPHLGRITVRAWNAGRMPVPATPLPGVGEEAAWAGELHEVIAEEHDLLCDVQVTGSSRSLRSAPTVAQQQAIGELCNRVFRRSEP